VANNPGLHQFWIGKTAGSWYKAAGNFVLMNVGTGNLAADEICVLEYLKHWPNEFVSKFEIARRAETRTRFLFDPTWADRALLSLMESGLVESNVSGQYRLPDHVTAATVKCGVNTMFIAPHLAEILGKSGRQFNLSA
jgi:hypothetical protein